MRYIASLCSLLAAGCITLKAKEPKTVVVDICPSVSEPIVQTEKVYSERVILPNAEAVEATDVVIKNDHVRFCTKEDLTNRGYIKVEGMEKLAGYGPQGSEIITITSKHHHYSRVFIRAEAVESVFDLLRYEFAIPIIRPLEDKCPEEEAKSYEVFKQNDVIPYKELKLIRKKY